MPPAFQLRLSRFIGVPARSRLQPRYFAPDFISTGKQVYIGYDNATGREYAQAVAVAEVFKSGGVLDVRFQKAGVSELSS